MVNRNRSLKVHLWNSLSPVQAAQTSVVWMKPLPSYQGTVENIFEKKLTTKGLLGTEKHCIFQCMLCR